jgi:L,D-peptidoglycan transpeptidase YkuD (ErfK/YbiS/YcfS/YnhG family)
MKKNLFRIFMTVCMMIILVAANSTNSKYTHGPLRSGQLIIVVTDNWNDVHAKLYAFEKRNGEWQLQFSFAAVVGERGMAMGEGIQNITITGAPQKKEGDMKSPAGMFLLGPAFGYATKSGANWIHMPYIRATDTLVCIDDPHSARYNELINSDTVEKDWNSHEDMHRKDHVYEWGLFIQYNNHPVKTGMGSCIFLHIWEGDGKGTAGCTAMEEKNILQFLHWIRADKHPLLVQFPEAVYRKIHTDYQLPSL